MPDEKKSKNKTSALNDLRLKIRDALVGAKGSVQGAFPATQGGAGDASAQLHRETAGGLFTDLVNRGFPQPIAETLVNALGLGNEAVSALVNRTPDIGQALLSGLALDPERAKFHLGRVFDPAGFDPADIISNTIGIEQAKEKFSNFTPDNPQLQAVPRGEHGGKVPMGEFTMRVPAADLQKFQSGGLVGEIVSQLQNVNVPQVGNIGQIAQNLQGFNPFAGNLGQTAQGSLQNILQTGAPTDVSGITDVAQARAARTFGDLTSGINEQFGALGLGSSSAREAQLGREASRLSQGVGEAGVLAGVGAQESAAGRQLAAQSPFLQSQNLGIQAQLGAGGLQQGAGQLNLAQQIQPAQAQSGLAQSLFPVQAGQINQPPQQGQSPFGATQVANPFAGQNPAQSQQPPQQGALGRRFQEGGEVTRFGNAPQQGGGGREDFGDFLSNFLFGQQFNRMPQQAPIPALQPQQGLGANMGGGSSLQQAQLRDMFANLQRAQQPGVLGSNQAAQGRNDLTALINQLGNIGQPSPSTQVIPGSPGQRGLQALSVVPGLGGLLEEGGMIQGPSQPPDQVPIMAQGGEVILPLDIVAELEQSNSQDPLIAKIKQVAQQSPQQGAQFGGQLDTTQGNEFLQLLQGLTEPQQFGEGIIATGGDVPSFTQQTPGQDFTSPVQGSGGFAAATTQPSPEQGLQEDINFAKARVNRLQALALASPRGAQGIKDLASAAEQELNEAEARLQDVVLRATPTTQQQVTDTTIRGGRGATQEPSSQEEFNKLVANQLGDPDIVPTKETFESIRDAAKIFGFDVPPVVSKRIQELNIETLEEPVEGAGPHAPQFKSIDEVNDLLAQGEQLSISQLLELEALDEGFFNLLESKGLPPDQIIKAYIQRFPAIVAFKQSGNEARGQ